MNKSQARALGLKLRQGLCPDEVSEKSGAIRERLWTLESLANASTVLTYVSSKDNEVDTLEIIRTLLSRERRVLVPVVQPGRQLAWSRLERLDVLAPSRFGVLEPVSEAQNFVEVPEGAVCLVPGIVFTRSGHRIGYGGGYFDRFLPSFGGASIGLAFEVQLSEEWMPDAYDVPVTILVTECGTYSKGYSCS